MPPITPTRDGNTIRGPSTFDRRNVAFVNYIYEIPAFRNTSNAFEKSVLGGWEIAGISSFESGPPLNVTLGGTYGSNGVQNGTNYPNLSGTISYPKARSQTAVQWFPGSIFTAPAAGAWGTLGHDALRGPGRDVWNIALHKTFRFTENSNFEFRAESFNTFNHPQWEADNVGGGGSGYGANCGWKVTNGVGSCQGSNFGAITGAYDPRVFQLYGKITF